MWIRCARYSLIERIKYFHDHPYFLIFLLLRYLDIAGCTFFVQEISDVFHLWSNFSFSIISVHSLDFVHSVDENIFCSISYFNIFCISTFVKLISISAPFSSSHFSTFFRMSYILCHTLALFTVSFYSSREFHLLSIPFIYLFRFLWDCLVCFL